MKGGEGGGGRGVWWEWGEGVWIGKKKSGGGL